MASPATKWFQTKIGALYNVAFTIKMTFKFAGRDYAVCKLEGLWWGNRKDGDFPAERPGNWNWKLMIRAPDFIGGKDLTHAIAKLRAKGKAPEVAAAFKCFTWARIRRKVKPLPG